MFIFSILFSIALLVSCVTILVYKDNAIDYFYANYDSEGNFFLSFFKKNILNIKNNKSTNKTVLRFL